MLYKFEIISVFCDVAKHILGNPAAVVLLDEAIAEDIMQSLAQDLNQPATTFLWPAERENCYHVRWFAPDAEIELCGHGALAALAFLKAQEAQLQYREGTISGGCLSESAAEVQLAAIPVTKALEIPAALTEGLGEPIEAYYQTSGKNIVLLQHEDAVRRMKPDFARLRDLETFAYAVTAPGKDVDFVSRTLVPHVQQLEDHATGSSHAALAPFWSNRLERSTLSALQLSPRGGAFGCKIVNSGAAVGLTGEFRLVCRGEVIL